MRENNEPKVLCETSFVFKIKFCHSKSLLLCLVAHERLFCPLKVQFVDFSAEICDPGLGLSCRRADARNFVIESVVNQ